MIVKSAKPHSGIALFLYPTYDMEKEVALNEITSNCFSYASINRKKQK
jgi:hypothetical protein